MINTILPCLALQIMNKGQNNIFILELRRCTSDPRGEKPANTIWPCLAVQVMTKGNTGKHNLAMSYCSSNDCANNCVLPSAVQLNLAMPFLARNYGGPAPAFSSGHASLCKQ